MVIFLLALIPLWKTYSTEANGRIALRGNALLSEHRWRSFSNGRGRIGWGWKSSTLHKLFRAVPDPTRGERVGGLSCPSKVKRRQFTRSGLASFLVRINLFSSKSLRAGRTRKNLTVSLAKGPRKLHKEISSWIEGETLFDCKCSFFQS